MEKVIFNMASIPQREQALKESIESILPQCDAFNIYLNDWDHVPAFLNHPKIKIYRSQDELGDLGDVGKFYTCDEWMGYIFTADDKIIYPSDYVKVMIAKIEEHGRRAVISCHGRNLKPKCKSYYWDVENFFGCLRTVRNDEWVHEIGTGVMAFHTDTFCATLQMFPHINMTDIYFSLELQKAKVPMLIKAHAEGWIRVSRKHDNNYSIFNFCNKNDAFQTSVVNNFKWQKLKA
jgi:hypothetical protein